MKFKKSILLIFSLFLSDQLTHPIDAEGFGKNVDLSEALTWAATAIVVSGLYIYSAHKQGKLLNKIFKDESFTDAEIKELNGFVSNITDIGGGSKIPGLCANSYYQHFRPAYFLKRVLLHPQLKLNKEIVDTCAHIVLANLSSDSIWGVIDAYLVAVSSIDINEDDADSLCENLLKSQYAVDIKKSSAFNKLISRSNKLKRKLVLRELENYLSNKTFQGYCFSPLLKKLKRFKETEKIQPLLPNLHELKKGPTTNYVKKYPQRITKKLASNTSDQFLARLSKEIIILENQEHDLGHYTFVHGEPKEMHSLQYWFTKLYEITHNINIKNYLFTRFKHKQSEDDIVDAHNKRITILQKGSRLSVFMGYSLYSNSGSANPADYYLQDRGIYSYFNSLNKIFKQFGYQNIYQEFETDLLALEREYRDLSPHGRILLLSFSPESLAKCVHPCRPGGNKIMVTINRKKTDNMLKIAQTLKKNPSLIKNHEDLEFCFIPTIDYGLHPNVAGKDVRIFSLNGADPEKMKAYKEKEQALFEKIKAAITRA